MGRAWVSHSRPWWSKANSTSWGAPKRASTRAPRRASSTSRASERRDQLPAPPPAPAASATRCVPPPGVGTMATPASPVRRSSTVPLTGIDDEVVRRHGPRDDRLPQPRAGVDHGPLPAPREGVGGKQDAGHGGVHQDLHHHRQAHPPGVDPVRRAVGHGPLRPQRGPAATHGVLYGVRPHHIEEVSCCPAKLAKGRSSAVAEERTASGAPGLRTPGRPGRPARPPAPPPARAWRGWSPAPWPRGWPGLSWSPEGSVARVARVVSRPAPAVARA